MSINGKRDGITLDDIRTCAKSAMMKRGRAEKIVEEVGEAVMQWPDFAGKAGVTDVWTVEVKGNLRMDLPR